jgi:hypothetical protein
VDLRLFRKVFLSEVISVAWGLLPNVASFIRPFCVCGTVGEG